MNKILLLPVLSILLFCAPAFADFAKGLDAAQLGDYATAMKEWKSLSEQGDSSAQFNLGLMYHNGQGVTQDYTRAHMWWNIAASQGDKDSVKNRDLIAKKMTPSQIEKAQTLAGECVAKNYKGC
jgi:TPR repeat protein